MDSQFFYAIIVSVVVSFAVSDFIYVIEILSLAADILLVIITDHAHTFCIAGPIQVLASCSSFRSSKLVIAFLTEAFCVMFSGYMRASRYAHLGFPTMLNLL